MNFNIDLSFNKTPYLDKENCLSDRNTHQSYRSNSYGISPVKKNMSINKNDEAKQQLTINFKQNLRRQRGFSGQATNSTSSAEKSTSRFSAEKKSKFRLEFEPKLTAAKSTNKSNAKSPINSTQRVRQNTPSIPSFKKKYGVGLRKSVTQAQNSIRKFMFNQTHKDNNIVMTEQNTKIKEQLFKQLKISDFVIGKFLGKGIYGEVSLVRHKLTRWIMAMKIIRKTTILNNQKLMNQTIEEIKIHSFVNHPNICSMYGYFSDETNVYLLLELCADKSLYSIMKTQKVLPQDKAIQYINQLTNSLQYLHSNDIIHRDIKPENILLNCDIIKLTDFGWSAYCSDGMRSTVCGTPLYLSPQLIKGQQYNSQTDIWALGILSYELVCGKTPFKIKQRSHLSKIINDEIQFPLNKQISQNYKDFVTKCLQKQQQKRANINELSQHEMFKNQQSMSSKEGKPQI